MPKKEARPAIVEETGLARRLRELGAEIPINPLPLRPSILLCPQVPKPLHGLAPRVVLGAKWWEKTRKEAYRSTNNHCLACGVSKYAALFRKWVEGHEIYEIDYLLGRMVYLETVPVCNACHSFIHIGRTEMLAKAGKITEAKYKAILEHGYRVLREAKLPRPAPYSGPEADWTDWRLVIGKKTWKPLWKNELQWAKHHEALLKDE